MEKSLSFSLTGAEKLLFFLIAQTFIARLWNFVENRIYLILIRHFNGNYTDYRTWLAEREEAETPAKEVKKNIENQSVSPAKRKPSFKEKQEYEQLQEQIASLEKRKAELTGLMSSGVTEHTQLTAWSQELETINSDIDLKTERWLVLAEIVEQ